MAVFDLAIESNSGRVNVKTVAMNAFKGFFACALVGVLPVEIYKFCVSLQNTFAGDLIRVFNDQYGLPIDNFRVLSRAGLVQLIDLLGGVDVNLEEAMTLADVKYKGGVQTLSGVAAVVLAYFLCRRRERKQNA